MRKNELQVTVRIYLRGSLMDPDVVTNAIKLPPEHIRRRGEPLSPTRPNKLSEFGVWAWAIESDTAEGVIARALAPLVKAVAELGHPLFSIDGVEEAWVDVHCLQVIDLAQSDIPDVEFSMTDEEVAQLKNLGMGIYVTASTVVERVDPDVDEAIDPT